MILLSEVFDLLEWLATQNTYIQHTIGGTGSANRFARYQSEAIAAQNSNMGSPRLEVRELPYGALEDGYGWERDSAIFSIRVIYNTERFNTAQIVTAHDNAKKALVELFNYLFTAQQTCTDCNDLLCLFNLNTVKYQFIDKASLQGDYVGCMATFTFKKGIQWQDVTYGPRPDYSTHAFNTWLHGNGVPDNSIGINGDFYIVDDNTDAPYYLKVSGAWVFQRNLAGSGGGIGTETDPVFTAHAAHGITNTNITNWNTAFGWGNHASAGYLTAETDPVFTAHAAHGITNTNITNWNTAFGWGNHASAGYLSSEQDPIFAGSVAYNISTGDVANWNEAHGWGDHAVQGYLTAETDPVFVASAAHGITNTNITNWNTAYGWGNHATAGYLTAAPVTSVNGYTGAVSLTTSDIAEGSNLYYTNTRAIAQVTATNFSGTLPLTKGGTGTTTGLPVNNLIAATAGATLDHAAYAQEWQWNSLAGGTGLKLSAATTAATGSTQKLLELALSGANGTSGQTTYSSYVTNTHTGTGSVNVAGYFSASGGSSNYGLIVAAGNVGIGTTTPGTPLEVNNATSGAVSFLKLTQTSRTGYILLSNGTSGASTFQPRILGVEQGSSLAWEMVGQCSSDASGDLPAITFDARNSASALSNRRIWGVGSYITGTSDYKIILTADGKIGVGVYTPTAVLHLKAGTATANTAPLKLSSGTNLTTAEAGAMEYNGTNLFFTRSGTTRENIVCASTVNTVSPTSPNRTITVNINGTTYYLHAKTTND